jgi:hypothetical protein
VIALRRSKTNRRRAEGRSALPAAGARLETLGWRRREPRAHRLRRPGTARRARPADPDRADRRTLPASLAARRGEGDPRAQRRHRPRRGGPGCPRGGGRRGRVGRQRPHRAPLAARPVRVRGRAGAGRPLGRDRPAERPRRTVRQRCPPPSAGTAAAERAAGQRAAPDRALPRGAGPAGGGRHAAGDPAAGSARRLGLHARQRR